MTFEQWQRVKTIVSEARTKDPAERAAFVLAACGGDQTLWREASSLLDSFDRVGDRFEHRVPAQRFEPSSALTH